jgi:hypothetical protein
MERLKFRWNLTVSGSKNVKERPSCKGMCSHFMSISLYPSVAVLMAFVCVGNKVRIMMYDGAIVFWLQVSRSSERVWLGNV